MIDLSLGNLAAWAVQVAAIGTAGGLLPLVLRVTSPKARLVYLRAVLVACLVLPILQPWVPMPAQARATVAVPAMPGDEHLVVQTGPGHSAAPLAPASWRASGILAWLPARIESVVAAVYVTGLLVRLAWLGLGLISLSRLRRASLGPDPRPAAVAAAVMLVGADAEFRVSPRVVRPVTFGLRRPVVLVPPDFLSFDPAQQTAVAAHE
ncbi:MAG: hypothetical protein NTY02_07085, partial [Acidobacteria bacterium]|nr:hypothetical protein [Acidobacteriota bacterium]